MKLRRFLVILRSIALILVGLVQVAASVLVILPRDWVVFIFGMVAGTLMVKVGVEDL